MRAYRRKGKIDEEWQEFLSQTNGSMRISNHCLFRVAKRFPELLEVTENEFLKMAKDSKPVYTFHSSYKQTTGIVVRNDKLAFVISFKTKKIMTVFPYKKSTVKRLTLNPKGVKREKKSAYHRPSSKAKMRQEMQQET